MDKLHTEYIENLIYESLSEMANDKNEQELLSIVKSGEKVYHRPSDSRGSDPLAVVKSLFKYGFSREYTGSNGGNMYGTGVYNVYNLRSSNENANGYGRYIVQSYVIGGYKDFLIFNSDIAKKYYGNDWWIGKQIKRLFPEKIASGILRVFGNQLFMNDYNSLSKKTASLLYKIFNFVGESGMRQTKIRGFIYDGWHDGSCAFVRDFSDVCPYAWSSDNGKTWKTDVTEELMRRVVGNIDTEFELKDKNIDGSGKFDNVAKKSINGFAMVYRGSSINYYSVETKSLISDTWFDMGTNFDDDGFAEVLYNNEKLCIEDNGGGQYTVTDIDGCPICDLKDIKKFFGGKQTMKEAYNFGNAKARKDHFRSQHGGDDTEGNMPDLRRLKISDSQIVDPVTKRNMHNVYIYNLEKEDIKTLTDRLTGDEYTRFIGSPRRGVPNTLLIKVFNDDMRNWETKTLPIIQNILRDTGHYNEKEVNDLPGLLSNVNMTKEELQTKYIEAQNKAIDVWLEYIKNIENPEVMKNLEDYKKVYKYLDTSYGLVKSVRNVATILAAAKSFGTHPTFILTANEWKQLNRLVKPGAHKYYVQTPLLENDDKKTLDKAIEKVIGKDNGTLPKYDDLSWQQKLAVKRELQKFNAAPPFTVYLEFDIEDTELIPGKEDKIKEEIGLSNNLTGALNQKAQEDYNSRHNISQEEETENKTNIAADVVTDMCKKIGINVNFANNASASNRFIGALMSYYSAIADKDANIIKDSNKNAFAENATYFTLIMTGLALNQSGRFAHSAEFTKEEGAEFLNSVTRVLNKISIATTYNSMEATKGNESQLKESSSNSGFTKQEILQKFKQFCNKVGIKII